MKENDFQEVKEKLLQEKTRLEKELSSIGSKNKEVPNDFNSRFPNWGDDVDSNAAEVNTYSSRLGVEKNLEQMLSSVITALEKIEKGTYGKCENCQQAIQPARLAAFPAATTCIDCQKSKK